jgi:hypothetical protein
MMTIVLTVLCGIGLLWLILFIWTFLASLFGWIE